MREDLHTAMGKLTETLAQMRASWRDRSRASSDGEIHTGANEPKDRDHRRDADPARFAELEALALERSRIQSLLMTGGFDAGEQIAALAERAERLRRDLVADAS